ncbi:carboxypeptidase-like regulatory domain-containing protein [Kordia sp.]|uniref:carboxypeptidase-like regulatory domain-containing protein n=1 Tax=Kordia sp. TaxID=1965332 RepID=UPI003D2E0274
MKHPKITINIPEPCHEDWNKMTPTQKGKFCGVCTKEVVDFTAESDEAIVKHFQKNDTVCGRFHNSQLNRKLIVDRKKRNHWVSYAASLLFPMALLSQEVKKDIKHTPKTIQTDSSYTSLNIGSLPKIVKNDTISVSGIISDDTGFPLLGATINIKGSKTKTTTDFDGVYQIDVKRNAVLVISYVGYKTVEIKATKKNHNFSLEQVNSLVEVQLPPYHYSRLGKVNIGSISIVKSEDIKVQTDSLTVSGVITDNTGLPLPGATVQIKNTKKGVTTDFDGNYKINLKKNDILIFNYVGFETLEIKATKNNHDVQLALGDFLGEVVTVGGAMTTSSWIEHSERSLTKEQKENKNRIENYFAFQKKKWKEKREKRRAKRAARKAKRTAKAAENKKSS